MQNVANFQQFRKRVKLNGQLFLVLSIMCIVCAYNVLTGIDLTTSKEKSRVSVETAWIYDDDIVYKTIQTLGEHESDSATSNILSKKTMIISLYNKRHGNKWFNKSEMVFTAQQCGHLRKPNMSLFSMPCKITSDPRYFSDSDAILFHSRNLVDTKMPVGYRNPNQLWVYLQEESPIHTFSNLKKYSNLFNWTMTFRRDSDVYFPYSYFLPRAQSSNGNSSKFDLLPSTLTNKTGLVAWIVSHCHPNSKRELIVQQLQKYIKVDVFGGCGKLKCPPVTKMSCYGYVASKYKMYLSFENSLCTDYITEKFFKALQYNMLPIVYGGGKSESGKDYSRIAPKNSYINARSFNNPKRLANYLDHLNRNESEFLEYFEWKKKYQVLLNKNNRWCSVCQKLYEHLNTFPPRVQWYKDLWTWWNNVPESFESKGGGNKITLPLFGRRHEENPGACVSPPNRLIGSDDR